MTHASHQSRVQDSDFALAQAAAIIEFSDDAIISKDLQGIVRTWNPGVEHLFGYAADEMIGQPVLRLIPPERCHEETEILERLQRGERIDHYETVRRRKDGSLVEISLTISPLKDRTGRIVGASKIARDISSRKRTERQFEELVAALPAAVYTTDASGSAVMKKLKSSIGSSAASVSTTMRPSGGEKTAPWLKFL